MQDYSCEISGRDYCFLREIVPPKYLEPENYSKIIKKKRLVSLDSMRDVADDCANICMFNRIACVLFSERTLNQLRAIADYRFVLGERENREISPEEATRRWINDGYAKSFAPNWKGREGGGKDFGHWLLFTSCESDIDLER